MDGSGGVPPDESDQPEPAGADQPELARMRAEVARLQAEVSRLRQERRPRPGRAGRRAGRWTGAVVVLVVAALLGVVSVVAGWVRGEVLDTDRYVASVAPLARDPAVQDAVSARLATEIVDRVDVAELVASVVAALEERGAPAALEGLVAPVVSGLESFLTNQVHAVVTSDQFAQIWETANRVAHDDLSALLTGEQGRFLASQGDAITIDLGQFLGLVRDRLVAAGFTPAQRIPDVSIPYTLARSDALPRLQTATTVLNNAAWVLPVVALLLLAGGVALAPDRRRGLLLGAVALALALLLALAALGLARSSYLANLPEQVQSPPAAAAVWDIVLRFLRDAFQTGIVLALIVAVACWLVGPARIAVAIRNGVGRLLDAAGRAAGRTGVALGPVPGFLAGHRGAIRVGVIAAAVVVLVLWRQPGISGTLWLTVAVLGVLGLVEIAARTTPVVTARA